MWKSIPVLISLLDIISAAPHWSSPLPREATGFGPCASVGSKFSAQLLRTLPAGASITWGQDSTDGNGYRDWILKELTANGATVDLVGAHRHGEMADDYNEGYPGFRVDQLTTKIDNILYAQPNLILLNVATDDAVQNYDLDTVGERYQTLVEKFLDNIPGTVVIASSLLVSRNSDYQKRIDQVNPQISTAVQNMAAAGKLVYLADMSSITTNEINSTDGIHPTDYGYEVMGGIWYKAVQEVYAKCWITAPNAEKTN